MESFVHPFAEGLSLLAHLLGGSYGLAVVAIAVAVRLVLLPLTLRLAEQGWHRQQRMRALQPKLDALRERHAKDPLAYARAAQVSAATASASRKSGRASRGIHRNDPAAATLWRIAA